MWRYSWLIFIFVLFTFSSCTTSPAAPTVVVPTVTYNPFATLSPTPFGPLADSLTSIPSATPIQNTPIPTEIPVLPTAIRTQYILNAALDYINHAISVDEDVIYQNVTGITLDQIVLAVEPNHWSNCFFLEDVTVNAQVVPHLLIGHRLEVSLATPLVPGATVNLSLSYQLNLPAADSFHLFGYKTNQINLVDWYPFIVPYANGWLLHEPAAVGEHLVYEAVDFDVSLITIPEMTIAASAPLIAGRYHLENARTFALSASPFFQKTTAFMRGAVLTSYYFEEDKNSGETVLQETAVAIDTFSAKFGVYPFPSLSIVEADFYDGMEYDGLFFLGRSFYLANDGTKLNYLIDLTVHETAHQWWFCQVGNDQALEPWLDEAFSTYSEYLFYEQVYPGVAETWWQFRVNNFSPSGAVDSSIYTTSEFQAYANRVYLRGALFIADLRTRIGDEVFFAFLKDYAFQMAGKIATADDFFRILWQHTRINIDDLREAYFQIQP